MEILYRLYYSGKLHRCFDTHILGEISELYYRKLFNEFIKNLHIIIKPLALISGSNYPDDDRSFYYIYRIDEIKSGVRNQLADECISSLFPPIIYILH